MDTRGAVSLKPGEQVRGYVPAVDVDLQKQEAANPKLIPWTKAAFQDRGNVRTANPDRWGSGQVPQHMIDQMYNGLPPVVRRSANERYEILVKRLMQMGRASQAKVGYPVWPESIQLILDGLGFSRRNTDLYAQVYALAKHFIVKSENQQRAKDRKKVVNDWHGHFD